MITIDRAEGEGGGQILRTSLALSLVTGTPFRIINIRAGRAKPGLLRQHLTAAQAATAVGDAATDGAEIGSTEFLFRPATIRPGEYRFAVGSAGSTTLVLQTILPALILASDPSHVTLEGGTHNPFAPPFDFLQQTFLPALTRFGPKLEATLDRPGFYPAGGGRFHIAITPVSKLTPLELLERGADLGRQVVAHIADLPSGSIAARALAQFEKRLGWPETVLTRKIHPPEHGPGFLLSATIRSEHHTETFTGFGERGVRAEHVADSAIDQVRSYLSCGAPVGEHLADQLLLPLALAGGGHFRTVGISLHARTNMAVIERFLPVRFTASPGEPDGTVVGLARA